MNAMESYIEMAPATRSDLAMSSIDVAVSPQRLSELNASLASRVGSYCELNPHYDKSGADRALIRAIGYHVIYGWSCVAFYLSLQFSPLWPRSFFLQYFLSTH